MFCNKLLVCILTAALIFNLSGCKKSFPREPVEPSSRTDQVLPVQPDLSADEQGDTQEPVQPANGLVPIEISLPRPQFVGTPPNIEGVSNLEKPLGRARPPFLAPAGTTNVASGKPVTGSEENPIMGEPAMVTDGDKEASDGSYVELGPFKQHVTIDLQEQCNIYAIVVWHYHKQPTVYFDVVVMVSDEPDFIDPKIVFNNDMDNTSGFGVGQQLHYVETNEGKLIDAKGISGRYVRLYSNGNSSNDLNHYIEVEVYGTPAQ